jgi:hypothetical protein
MQCTPVCTCAIEQGEIYIYDVQNTMHASGKLCYAIVMPKYENPFDDAADSLVQPTPQSIARRQVELAIEGFRLYGTDVTPDSQPDQAAAIALRNPNRYLQNLAPGQLSEELSDGWDELGQFAADVVNRVAPRSPLATEASGMADLQGRMEDGDITPPYRPTVAKIVHDSGILFAESVRQVPIDSNSLSLYDETNQQMARWICRYGKSEQ